MTKGLAPEPEALASTYLVLMVLKAFRALVEQKKKKNPSAVCANHCILIYGSLFLFFILELIKWASGFVSSLFDFFFFPHIVAVNYTPSMPG